MSRQTDNERLQKIVEAVEAHPAQKAGWLARLLGTDNKTITRALPQLEERGYLLAEDDDGRLTWFGRRRKSE